MSSNERTSVRARSRSGVASAPASRVSISLRRADSRTSASWISFAAFDTCADSCPPIAMQIARYATERSAPQRRSPRPLPMITEAGHQLPRSSLDRRGPRAACRRRPAKRALGLHHVHEPRGAAEANPQLALQIRDRRLAAAHDDARSLVVELVLLELEAARDRSCRPPR